MLYIYVYIERDTQAYLVFTVTTNINIYGPLN